MPAPIQILILVVVLAFPAILAAEEDRGLCPARIETQQNLKGVVNGFDPMTVKRKHSLDEVSFYYGRPEEMMFLAYNSERKHGEVSVLAYTMDKNSSYSIVCGYFGTSVALAKQLPPSTTRCEVSLTTREVTMVTCH